MKTLSKILGISLVAFGVLYSNNCEIQDSCPPGMEKLSIRKHGISNYIWYRDVCGQNYIPKEDNYYNKTNN